MFGFLRWKTTTVIPPPPPPPPPSIISSHVSTQNMVDETPINNISSTTQSMELIVSIMRIEKKLDIILTKLSALDKKYNRIIQNGIQNNTTHEIIDEMIDEKNEDVPINKPSKKYVVRNKELFNELLKKVDEIKIRKHMGESHGFESMHDMLHQDNSKKI
jgi:hypothetical protein